MIRICTVCDEAYAMVHDLVDVRVTSAQLVNRASDGKFYLLFIDRLSLSMHSSVIQSICRPRTIIQYPLVRFDAFLV